MNKHLLLIFQLLLFGAFSFAQTNITVNYSSGAYDEENSWQLYNVTADTEIDCYSEATTGSYSQSYVIPAGNIIELRAWETFGDEWSGATITLTNDDASFTHYSGPTTADGNGSVTCGTDATNGEVMYSGDPGVIPTLPDCPNYTFPLDMATDVSTDITFMWTAATTGYPADSYELFLGTTSGSLTSEGTTSNEEITVTDLQFNTTYYWRVEPINVIGANSSCSEFEFTTGNCPATALPYTEEFSGTALPSGWVGNINVSQASPYSAPSYAHENLYSSNPSATMRTEVFGPVGTDDELSFFSRVVNYSGYPNGGLPSDGYGTLDISISTDCGETFNPLASFGDELKSSSYLYQTTDLSSFVGENIILLFEATRYSGDYYLDIDDISIMPAPTCTEPQSLSAEDILDSSATINFVDGIGCTSSVSISISPAISGSPTSISCGVGTFNLTGLSPDTEYTVTLSNDCETMPSADLVFTTLPELVEGAICELPIAITLPYNTVDNTSNYGDDYGFSPGSNCGSTSSYLNGDDVVYSYTPATDEIIDIELTGLGSWVGVFVYADCADIGSNCIEGAVNSSTTNDISIINFSVTAGETYYILISTYANPQSTPYNLNISVLNNCAEGYSPINGATNVALECGGSTLLSWTAPIATVDSYNIYSGTTSGNLSLAGNTTETNNLLSGLNSSSLYYYEIRPIVGGVEESACEEISFTTGSEIVDSGSGGTENVYYFANNNNTNGTAAGDFVWDDPVNLGHTEVSSITSGSFDDGYITVQLPFTFKYYGVDYTECHIGTNGYVSFGSGFSDTGGGVVLGSTLNPDNMIALAMMDLDDNTDGKIYHGPIDGSTYAITWWHYHDFGDANEYISMQLILQKNPVSSENGLFEMRYNQAETSASIPDILADAVIGCEDVDANATTEYASYRENGIGGPMFCSPLTIGFAPTESGVNLPLELVEFDGQALDKYNELSWISLNEFNTSHFEIERSFDGKHWRQIGIKEANQFTDYFVEYKFIDYYSDQSAYYRLKMIDLDGKYDYSNTISVFRNSVNGNEVVIFPNPTSADINVNLDSGSDSNVNLKVTDITGKVLINQEKFTYKGSNEFIIQSNNFNPGVYFITIQMNNKSVMKKFIKE